MYNLKNDNEYEKQSDDYGMHDGDSLRVRICSVVGLFFGGHFWEGDTGWSSAFVEEP